MFAVMAPSKPDCPNVFDETDTYDPRQESDEDEKYRLHSASSKQNTNAAAPVKQEGQRQVNQAEADEVIDFSEVDVNNLTEEGKKEYKAWKQGKAKDK